MCKCANVQMGKCANDSEELLIMNVQMGKWANEIIENIGTLIITQRHLDICTFAHLHICTLTCQFFGKPGFAFTSSN